MSGPEEPHVVFSVQWRGGRPQGRSRSEQRVDLATQLSGPLAAQPEAVVDWESLSLAAQTVDVRVASGALLRVIRGLQDAGLRVDRQELRRIVEE